ncbi:MAG TPA: nucleoside-diphosphate sugar epimerase, partial [Polaribacter sp.]|nr:nucleoside-diphosphate sugar epimerase [Polaribacter sp.]
MGKTAIILGATGLTGGLLLDQLIVDSTYDK